MLDFWKLSPILFTYLHVNAGLMCVFQVHARKMAEDILVNACCLGWVQTDMTERQGSKTWDHGEEMPVSLALLPPGSPSGEFWEDQKVSVW